MNTKRLPRPHFSLCSNTTSLFSPYCSSAMGCNRLPDSSHQQLKYDPLASASSIRLLKIHASDDFDAPIQGTLTMTDVDHHECPYFTVVSYEWGSPLETSSITVDGGTIFVRNNLFNFLHHLSSSYRSTERGNQTLLAKGTRYFRTSW